MKIFLQTLTLFIAASTVISCSSDDNSAKTKVLVIDKMLNTSYAETWVNGKLEETEVFSQTTHTFRYDTKGNVSAFDVYRHDEIPYDGGYIYEANTQITYNAQNKIHSLYTTNKKTNAVEVNEVYEYDTDGRIMKSTDSVNENEKEYHFFTNDMIRAVLTTKNDHTTVNHFEYDRKSNLSKAVNPEKLTQIFTFLYNDRPNPFQNMSIDLTYNDFEFTYNAVPHLRAQHNISSYKIGDNMLWIIKYEYNAQGYPIKAEAYDKEDPSKLKRQIEYTYKEIEVKK